jgi:hypothetical protein
VQRQRRVAGAGRIGIIQRAVIGTAVPMKQRPVVKCTMGQGVTGTLDRVVLYSAGFSTCTPVIMFNEKSRCGGLFHFAAGRLDLQGMALGKVHDALVPSVIFIGDRSIKNKSSIKALDEPIEDVAEITNFLKDQWMGFCEINTLELRARQYYVTLDEGGKLLITPDWPGASAIDIDFTTTNKPKIDTSVAAITTDVLMFGKNLDSVEKPIY